MLRRQATIEETTARFTWDIPAFFNIGVDVCDKHAETRPEALAICDVDQTGAVTDYSFGDLYRMSNQLAHALSAHCAVGDRIAVCLSQRVETAVAHIAIAKIGAIALPLFTLFGPDALRHRLADSAARLVITDAAGAKVIRQLVPQLPALELIVCVDGASDGALDYAAFCGGQPAVFDPVQTTADTPALLIYTSGTTGPPKGALHAHRVLLGHLPGVEMSHDFFPQPGDKIWTPADWAWIGGLLDVLMPALHHGVPVVACRFRKFTAEAAFDLINRTGVRNAFLPPSALKMMRRDMPGGRAAMRSVASGGETLGAALIDWGRDAFGVTINEFYGQTECNMVVSSCAALAPAEPGVMGFAVPGHDVAVIDTEKRASCAVGEEGAIAVRAPDPVMFLGYWNNATATEAKFLRVGGADWLVTGDRGCLTASGRIRFVGRDDDVINSGGYRIGPAEIEDCLLTHPAVRMAGVVGMPDPTRGEIVAAYIVLGDGHVGTETLAADIARHVKSRLAAYEFPRAVRFVSEMPMTTTGKIIRSALREMARREVAGGKLPPNQ